MCENWRAFIFDLIYKPYIMLHISLQENNEVFNNESKVIKTGNEQETKGRGGYTCIKERNYIQKR